MSSIKPVIGIGSDVLHREGERDRAFAYLTYVEALRRGGAAAVLIPPQPENAADLLLTLDGILLAGGPDCDPSLYGEEPHASCEPMDVRRQENDLALARAARELRVPALGVCLGMQVMNVAGGGSLIQDIASEVETQIQHASEPENRARHDVRIDEGSRLAEIVRESEVRVNSSHHQAVRRLAPGLRVSAHAPDGVIEAIEDPAHPFYIGLQWHPEDMVGEHTATSIFKAFISAARTHREARAAYHSSPAAGVAAE